MARKYNPILDAAAEGKATKIREFLNKDRSANVVDANGRTPLMLAVRKGCGSCVTLLLDAGALVDVQDKKGYTALHHAADARASIRIFRKLLEYGASVNYECKLGRTPIISLITANRPDAVALFLRRGADPNLETKEDETPLSFAVVWNRLRIAKLLVEAGANVRWKDKNGRGLLDYAEKSRDSRMRKFLESRM